MSQMPKGARSVSQSSINQWKELPFLYSTTENGPFPWTIRYGDAELQSYNVELARLLMGLLPEDEDRTEREQKVDLLYAIAAYLGEVRSRRGGSGVAAE